MGLKSTDKTSKGLGSNKIFGGRAVLFSSTRCTGTGTNPPRLLDPYCVGNLFEGGYLVCKSGGIGWIIAPSSTEVTRNRAGRNDTITRAQEVIGGTGWFIPDQGQLSNPGTTCKIHWDYNGGFYWASGGGSYGPVWTVSGGYGHGTYPDSSQRVRAFRCVAY